MTNYPRPTPRVLSREQQMARLSDDRRREIAWSNRIQQRFCNPPGMTEQRRERAEISRRAMIWAHAAQRGGEIIGWHHHAFFAPPATVADITGPGIESSSPA